MGSHTVYKTVLTFKIKSIHYCKQYGIPSCMQSLNVPVLWFWPDDGSMSRNMWPNF